MEQVAALKLDTQLKDCYVLRRKYDMLLGSRYRQTIHLVSPVTEDHDRIYDAAALISSCLALTHQLVAIIDSLGAMP